MNSSIIPYTCFVMKRTLFILFFIVLAFGFSTNASASISDGNWWGGCQSVVSKAMSFLSDKLGVKLAYAQVCFPPPVSVCTLNSAYNFWPMNEASNSFVDNVSGANDGTAVGTTIVPGKFGNARNFNGTSDYVNVGDIYTTGSAGTVSIWIKPSGNYSGTQMPFMGYTYPFVVGLGTAFNTTWCPGRWMLYLPNTPGLGNYGRVCSDLAYNDTNFPTNVWTHLAITYDGTWVRFYKNGAPVGSPVAQPAAGNSNNATFSIGRQGNYGEYFSGGIDEVGLWRLVLTPAQIFNLYNSGSSGLITNETTFSWPTYSFPSSSACGSYYRLTVTGSGGGTFAGLTNTSYHIDLYPSTSYTWTVDAMDYDPVSGCDYHTTPASPPPPFTTLACAPTTVDIKAEDLTDSIFKDGPVTIPSGASTTLQLTSTNADSLTASGDWSGPKLVTDGPASAAGGAITTSGGDTIHAFVTSGTFTPNGNGTVEVLVVAGGGGGGSAYAGGGGAGGLVHSSTYAVTSGVAIPVAVGGGGAQNNNGGNSVFGSITAVGGGSGGTGAGYAGNNGGSGGGGSGNGTGGGAPGGGWGIQGGRGGAGLNSGTCPGGGGGGGAGAVGTDSGANGGNGGNGRQYSISGSAVYYAGGGGGRSLCGTNGSGGFGGGGNYGVAGTVNTGGGGGGTVSGGSGIVIVRYRGPYDTDPLISSKTYTITSTNSYSSAVDSVTVNVSAPLTLSVSCLASPVTASVGQQVTWTASVSGGTGAYSYLWGGDAPLAGHAGNPVVVTYPTVGVKTGSVIVTSGSETVGPIACASSIAVSNTLPVIVLLATPSIVNIGSRATLTWSTEDTFPGTPCVASSNPVGLWSGDKAPNGSERSGPLNRTTTFNLTCSGPGGIATASKVVNVGIITEPPPQ